MYAASSGDLAPFPFSFFFALWPGRSVVWVMAVPFLGCFDLAEAQGQPDRFDILMHCLMAGNSKWQPSL